MHYYNMHGGWRWHVVCLCFERLFYSFYFSVFAFIEMTLFFIKGKIKHPSRLLLKNIILIWFHFFWNAISTKKSEKTVFHSFLWFPPAMDLFGRALRFKIMIFQAASITAIVLNRFEFVGLCNTEYFVVAVPHIMRIEYQLFDIL